MTTATETVRAGAERPGPRAANVQAARARIRALNERGLLQAALRADQAARTSGSGS